jgi:hypothetical protein
VQTVDIDWADLELAFRDGSGTENHLDRLSGAVMAIVAGYADEEDLRELLARKPERFVRITPIDARFGRAVLSAFIAQLAGGVLKKRLSDLEDTPGGYSACIEVLKSDKPSWAAFARFEQAQLIERIEAFLADQGLLSTSPAPEVDLFEGMPEPIEEPSSSSSSSSSSGRSGKRARPSMPSLFPDEPAVPAPGPASTSSARRRKPKVG